MLPLIKFLINSILQDSGDDGAERRVLSTRYCKRDFWPIYSWISEQKDFSNTESPCHPDQVSAHSNLEDVVSRISRWHLGYRNRIF